MNFPESRLMPTETIVAFEDFLTGLYSKDISGSGFGVITVAVGDVYQRMADRLEKRLAELDSGLPFLRYTLPEDGRGIEIDVPCRRQRPLAAKATAIVVCPFQRVLFLDADTLPVQNPRCCDSWLTDNGAVLWTAQLLQKDILKVGNRRVVEGGHILVHKDQVWMALSANQWLNNRSDETYVSMAADSHCLQLAFEATNTPYLEPPAPLATHYGLLQFDLNGNPMFEHRLREKF